MDGAQVIIEERLPNGRNPLGDDLVADCLGVLANLLLRVLVHPERQEVQQVPEVDFPVGFGVGGEGKILARLFAGNSTFDPIVVDIACCLEQLRLARRQLFAHRSVDVAFTSLPVALGLQPPIVRQRSLRAVDGERIACAIFVD